MNRRSEQKNASLAARVAPLALVVSALLYSAFATRTLVLRDASGSLEGQQAALLRQTNLLSSFGFVVRQMEIQGFGVRTDGRQEGILATLLRELPNLDVNTVYVVSDFDLRNTDWDVSDAEGYDHLRAMLADRRIRLYLATVREAPELRFAQIAYESGGGWINPIAP